MPPELWLVPCLGFLLKMASHSYLEAESSHAVKGAFQLEWCTAVHIGVCGAQSQSEDCVFFLPFISSAISIRSGTIRVCFLLILEE